MEDVKTRNELIYEGFSPSFRNNIKVLVPLKNGITIDGTIIELNEDNLVLDTRKGKIPFDNIRDLF